MKIEILLNILHYCFYKAETKRHLLFNKLNPFVHIGRIPLVKKKFEEQGTTLLEVSDKFWNDKRYGVSIMTSGAALVIVVFLIFLVVFDILNSILQYPIKSIGTPFFLFVPLAYLICHYTVFKSDKYIRYFKQFDKWSSREKWKYGLLSFVFIVGVMTLFVWSFRFLPNL